MTDRQENKLSMYLAVLNLLEANTAVWQSKAAFAAAQTDFATAVATVQSLAQDQEAVSAGATAQKQARRIAVADAALPISGALIAYASVDGDEDLAANAAVTRSALIHGRDGDALTKAQYLLTLAQQHAAALADYEVSAATLTAFQAAVQAYAVVIQKPRTVITTRAASTAQIVDAFATADGILKKRLDPLSLIFRASAPAFYLAYRGAREIIDLTSPAAPAGEPEPTPEV